MALMLRWGGIAELCFAASFEVERKRCPVCLLFGAVAVTSVCKVESQGHNVSINCASF